MGDTGYCIKTETCSKCGFCVAVCPAFVIEKTLKGDIRFRPDFTSICLQCGQCMAVCKTKSIVVKGLTYEKNFFNFSETNNFFSILEHRRSVRSFKPKPLDKELIRKILDAVSQAPHGDTHHHVEVTVVNNRDKIMELLPKAAEFYDKLEKWLHNPVMRKIIQLKKGHDTLNTLKNHLLPRIEKGIYKNISYKYDGITRGAHTLFIFHAPADSEEHKEDAYIFVTYATLAAQALGLGSTIIGLIPAAINKTPELRKMLSIPDSHDTVVSLIAGYPKFKYQRAIKRELKNIHWID